MPGHEVVGRIAAMGAQVPPWRIGQRVGVGVGRLGGPCNACAMCRQGRFELCQDQPFVCSKRDGGYTEAMLARASGLVAIPDELDAMEAAPILCAGLATCNALKKCRAEAGDTVAISGCSRCNPATRFEWSTGRLAAVPTHPSQLPNGRFTTLNPKTN